ncbi:MAG: magnesium transporter [Coriobacteriia bacterium]|nr:magnesium transporter [Coriobacteriia bacterium]
MIYLSQMLGKPVIDDDDEQIGIISDIAIATGEVFPRVTALAFKGPDKTPFMLSWRKYVKEFTADAVYLNTSAASIRFSYLQPDEILLSRDLLNKQIVDTQGMKVVRVNDLKLSDSNNSLRLLGAEVGMRGLLRAISPRFEKTIARGLGLFGQTISENLIAWNYMDLLEHDLSQVKLSITHKRLHELHPADVADILEQLAPNQRAAVFAHLDNSQAAETISELEDEYQTDVIEDLSERRASDLLAEMDPDDAADVIGDLDYDKSERLLRLMGLEDSSAIRKLLGYREKTAGGIMTPEFTTATEAMTVDETIEHIRSVAEEHESIHYVYVVDEKNVLLGVVSLRELLLAPLDDKLGDIMERDIFVANPDDDQEDVAETISKYDLLAVPVVNSKHELLGIVTIDDALDVLEEEAEEDLVRATGRSEHKKDDNPLAWIMPRRNGWLIVWLFSLFACSLGLSLVSGHPFGMGDTILSAQNPYATLAVSLSLALIGVSLLPILLIIIEEASIRGVDVLTDMKAEDRPSTSRRYLFGLGVGAAGGCFAGIITFGFADLRTSATDLALAYGACVFIIALVCSQLVTALVNRAVLRDDEEKPVSPTGISAIAMIVCAALVLLSGIALVYFVPSFATALLG